MKKWLYSKTTDNSTAFKTSVRMKAASLCNGWIEGGEVVCPLHGYKFDLKTGACSTDPKLKVKVFKLVAQGRPIFIGRMMTWLKMKKKQSQDLTRRNFLKVSGGALGILLAGMPKGWIGGAYAADGPETTKIRFGIIALTDCSSIVMAHELGLFKKYGIESTISKEASWAAIRDKLNSRRKSGDAYAFRHAFRVDHGTSRLAGKSR